jgi:hypothetical protein
MRPRGRWSPAEPRRRTPPRSIPAPQLHELLQQRLRRDEAYAWRAELVRRREAAAAAQAAAEAAQQALAAAAAAAAAGKPSGGGCGSEDAAEGGAAGATAEQQLAEAQAGAEAAGGQHQRVLGTRCFRAGCSLGAG